MRRPEPDLTNRADPVDIDNDESHTSNALEMEMNMTSQPQPVAITESDFELFRTGLIGARTIRTGANGTVGQLSLQFRDVFDPGRPSGPHSLSILVEPDGDLVSIWGWRDMPVGYEPPTAEQASATLRGCGMRFLGIMMRRLQDRWESGQPMPLDWTRVVRNMGSPYTSNPQNASFKIESPQVGENPVSHDRVFSVSNLARVTQPGTSSLNTSSFENTSEPVIDATVAAVRESVMAEIGLWIFPKGPTTS